MANFMGTVPPVLIGGATPSVFGLLNGIGGGVAGSADGFVRENLALVNSQVAIASVAGRNSSLWAFADVGREPSEAFQLNAAAAKGGGVTIPLAEGQLRPEILEHYRLRVSRIETLSAEKPPIYNVTEAQLVGAVAKCLILGFPDLTNITGHERTWKELRAHGGIDRGTPEQYFVPAEETEDGSALIDLQASLATTPKNHGTDPIRNEYSFDLAPENRMGGSDEGFRFAIAHDDGILNGTVLNLYRLDAILKMYEIFLSAGLPVAINHRIKQLIGGELEYDSVCVSATSVASPNPAVKAFTVRPKEVHSKNIIIDGKPFSFEDVLAYEYRVLGDKGIWKGIRYNQSHFLTKTLFTGGGLAGAATAFLSGGWFVAGVATGGTIALAAFLLGMARLADSISETKSLDGESLLPYAAMGDLRAIFEHLQQNDEYEPQLLVSFAKYALQRTALGGRDARMGVSAWYYTACAAADLLSQKGKPDLERIFKEILAAGEDVEIGRFRHNLAAQIPLGKFIDMVKLLPHAPKALRLLEEYTNIDLSSFVDEIEIKWRKNMIVDKGDVEWLVSKGNNSVINWLFDAAIYHHNDSASEALEWLANEKGNVLARELLKIPMPE